MIVESDLGSFKNELTDHTITLWTGPDGFFTELVCPDDCPNMEWHQEDWADNGFDSLVDVDDPTVIGVIPVNPEVKKVPETPDHAPDEELWFRPVVPEGD